MSLIRVAMKQSSSWRAWWGFVQRVGREFHRDRCPQVAAALSYTTVLALVPLLAVSFSTLALVPAFRGWQQTLEAFIFANVVPARGVEIQRYLTQFIDNASALQATGMAFLVLSVIGTMATVEATFNDIWEVPSRRSKLRRSWLFVVVLGLAPLAIGTALAISSFLYSLPRLEALLHLKAIVPPLLVTLPFVLTLLTVTWSYSFIPNCAVEFRHAAHGGLLATILFELTKHLFGLYLTTFPAQELIYGAFAAVPIFLIWIYLAWLVMLFGAEYTHGLAAYGPMAIAQT